LDVRRRGRFVPPAPESHDRAALASLDACATASARRPGRFGLAVPAALPGTLGARGFGSGLGLGSLLLASALGGGARLIGRDAFLALALWIVVVGATFTALNRARRGLAFLRKSPPHP